MTFSYRKPTCHRKKMNTMTEHTHWITGRGAFFISPEGEFINVSSTYHIQVITDNPAMFGLSLEHIRDTYSKYNEKMNVEGKARAEIIMKIIEQGWIHIRKEVKSCWIINAWELNETTRKLLAQWAHSVLTGTMGVKELNCHAPVTICTVDEVHECTMHQLGTGTV